jgi:hypothetical protein
MRYGMGRGIAGGLWPNSDEFEVMSDEFLMMKDELECFIQWSQRLPLPVVEKTLFACHSADK